MAMKTNKIGAHPAPTPLRPLEYTLFFIPGRMLKEVEGFLAGLDEPEEHFLLVSVMKVEQLACQPGRINRADVRAITERRAGIWVALAKPQHAVQLRTILDQHDLA